MRFRYCFTFYGSHECYRYFPVLRSPALSAVLLSEVHCDLSRWEKDGSCSTSCGTGKQVWRKRIEVPESARAFTVTFRLRR